MSTQPSNNSVFCNKELHYNKKFRKNYIVFLFISNIDKFIQLTVQENNIECIDITNNFLQNKI